MKDSELVEKARKGDAEAIEILLDDSHNRLLGYARSLMGEKMKSKMRASDIVQSTCREVLERVDEFRGEDENSFRAWVSVILTNNLRRKRRYLEAAKRLSPEVSLDHDVLEQSDDRTASMEMTQREDTTALLGILSALPAEDRELLRLRLLEEEPYTEIAERLGQSEASLRTRVSRLRAAMLLARKKQGL